MEQKVTVVAIEGEHVLVQGRRASACGKCVGKSSCSTMGSWVERVAELRVRNSLQADVGDEIVLDVPDGLLLSLAFQLYGLPMLAFVVTGVVVRSIAVAAGWPQADALAAVAGFVAVLACYALIHRRVSSGRTRLDVRMVRVERPQAYSQSSN
ncbi:positive regulator for alginate biosynthesis MucC [Mariprofundus erugo]|uniref:Positive regulator for alginate biosynthesis MucC n=1 Tax=Mariprofundus erugo TaxID=2528639 RepID=A0A5R9H167_9PROT|nr:SoxR reducing system RseC family protein [Mariprofundus erugo]TLS68674.1 positive regulator for alginate biosynthesis MucC [Mariprofundus erugo]TLS77633.1 positive regulator for alginate biosynthesis MucC [Mariprofundus erugo]